MPKTTFFKLTKEKQQSLIDAAMSECARSSFDDMKISNIIKLAKIPRSSFYDYFEDKEDLFLYLLSIVKETKQTFMAPYLQKESSSFFERIRELLKAGALFANEYPEYEKLAKKFYEDKQLMHELLGQNQQSMVSLYEGLIKSGMDSGEVNSNLDAKFLSECLYHLTANLFLEGFTDKRTETVEEYIAKRTDSLLSLLKNGMGTS